MVAMKTTLDLPSDLVKEVKIHAVNEGKKLKGAVADLLRKGLGSPVIPLPSAPSPKVSGHSKTGLPYFAGSSHAPAKKMTPAQLIALEQETTTSADLEQLGLPSGH